MMKLTFAEECVARQYALTIFAEAVSDSVARVGHWVSTDRGLLLHRPSYEGCEWRITRFEGDLPTGHTEFQSLDSAIRDLYFQAQQERREAFETAVRTLHEQRQEADSSSRHEAQGFRATE